MTEEEGQAPVQQYYSHNQNYKACVFKDASTQFRVHLYKWCEDAPSEKEDDGAPVWENIAGPFVVESLPAAQTLAQQHLPMMAGETLDRNIDETLSNQIETTLGHPHFDFLEIKNFKTSFLEDEEAEDFIDFDPASVLLTEDFYFVEDLDGKWLAGFLYQEGEIRCWKRFPNLGQALLTIKAGEF